MGYKAGKGLGKVENGIKEPIVIKEAGKLKEIKEKQHKLIYILSD